MFHAKQQVQGVEFVLFVSSKDDEMLCADTARMRVQIQLYNLLCNPEIL
jgi:hypothetical protein